MFIAYTIAIFLADRFKGIFGAEVFRVALVAGIASGLVEILTIAGENNAIALSVPAPLGLLSVFAIWGAAGIWAMLALRSMRAGVSASVVSAGVCMLIGVAGGVLIEMFVAPTKPAVVATWQEFRRSGWTNPEAFQIANTLDSAFGHLLFAPIVGLVVGTIGAGLCRLL